MVIFALSSFEIGQPSFALLAASWIVAASAQTLTVTNGLQLWLKADAGVTTGAGDIVTAWQDQSGKGNNAAQTTEAIFSAFGKARERAVLTWLASGNDLTLSWQATAVGAALQATPDLTAPAIWTNVPGSTLTNLVHVPTGSGRSFFRLAQ